MFSNRQRRRAVNRHSAALSDDVGPKSLTAEMKVSFHDSELYSPRFGPSIRQRRPDFPNIWRWWLRSAILQDVPSRRWRAASRSCRRFGRGPGSAFGGNAGSGHFSV